MPRLAQLSCVETDTEGTILSMWKPRLPLYSQLDEADPEVLESLGKQYADELVTYLKDGGSPGALTQISKAMKARLFGPVEIAFYGRLAAYLTAH